MEVLRDPEIYDRITDDNCPALEDFRMPDGIEATFIAGYAGGNIASLFALHHDNKFHYMVLKPYRKHARDLLKKSLALWGRPVWCEIPACYPEVINFARKSGFYEDKINKDAHMKNGDKYDTHIMRYENGIC